MHEYRRVQKRDKRGMMQNKGGIERPSFKYLLMNLAAPDDKSSLGAVAHTKKSVFHNEMALYLYK